MNLKFSGNVPNLVLGKVRKFQHRSFSGFGDIPEKPEGWMKTTPPATNRVNVSLYPKTTITQTAGGGVIQASGDVRLSHNKKQRTCRVDINLRVLPSVRILFSISTGVFSIITILIVYLS